MSVLSTPTVPLLIMAGTSVSSPIEQLVAGARDAATLDLVARARTVPGIGPVVVSTSSLALAEALRDESVHVELDPPGQPFHFGKRLRDLVCRHRMDRVFYIGGGAAPLLTADRLARVAVEIAQADALLISNNFYSTDWCAFTPTATLDRITLPAQDNDLAWQLVEVAGLPNLSPPRCAATQLDIDTPCDLITLAFHPDIGPHTRAYLDTVKLDTSRVVAVLPLLTDRDAEIVVAGRVSSAIWAYLETETACRVRVFSEERGMRASGRQAHGEARTVLGYLLEAVGLAGLFDALAHMGQAVFLDSRVIFAHRDLWPSANDRFNSDLYRLDDICDPWVREFTAAAQRASVPVLLGGHSLVAGGFYVLAEAAWARGPTLRRRVGPTPWDWGDLALR